ncbi:9567_t:CDS:2, partial [Cetraspora pellucida]
TVLHLETTSTSRIEGAHTTLKAYLQMSVKDLYRVYTTISLAVDNQKKKIDNITESERIRFPTFAIKNVLYENIRACESLKDIIDTQSVTLHNPNIVHTKGCPPGASNQQQTNSTRRDPFGF